jgi:hypothetical protein
MHLGNLVVLSCAFPDGVLSFIEFYIHAIDSIEPGHSMTTDAEEELFSSKGHNWR